MQRKPGTKLINDIIADVASADPDKPFAHIPRGPTVDDGYETIGFSRLSVAVDRAAWLLDEYFGKAEPRFSTTVGYIGPQDLCYILLVLAGSKTGHRIFLPSLRNSTQAHVALIDAYECTTIILPATEGPILRKQLEEVFQARDIRTCELPDNGYFLSPSASDTMYGSKAPAFKEARWELLMALQTSRTTGIPKPVVMPQACLTAVDAYQRMPRKGHAPVLFSHFAGKKMVTVFPFFHAAGLTHALHGILYGFEVVSPPAAPITAELVAQLVEKHDADVALLPPSIITDLARDPALCQSLQRLEYILYAGGPLPEHTGCMVSGLTHLANMYGSSELTMVPSEKLDAGDWQYFKWPTVAGVEMQPYGDDLHELFIRRNTQLADYQVIFISKPELKQYETNDLFSKHPNKKGLWRFRGRKDDIVVYSSGEKFNPTSMEDAINGHPEVRSALVVGDGRFQSALLVESTSAPVDEAAKILLVDEIWPTIDHANEDAPAYARIFKDMVVITFPGKPFLRAGKGTVQRRMTLDQYQIELDALYSAIETASATSTNGVRTPPPTPVKHLDIEVALKDAIGKLGPRFDHVALDDDLFDEGLDSLGVVTLVRLLRPLTAQFNLSRKITTRNIYQCRSLRRLTHAATTPELRSETPAERMQRLYDRYAADLPLTARHALPKPRAERMVLLTGSTGSSGPYLLDNLLHDSTVASIACLNRNPGGRARQRDHMKSKGLSQDFERKAVQFLRMDMSKPYLGLDFDVYHHLLAKVTHVIHNAWQVDFNLLLEGFATAHLNGVRQLIDFSMRSKYGASIFFISSISTVTRRTDSSDALTAAVVPETSALDWSVAERLGYAQSKLVAEKMLEKAATEAGVHSTICRAGQIAGPTTEEGMWPA